MKLHELLKQPKELESEHKDTEVMFEDYEQGPTDVDFVTVNIYKGKTIIWLQ